MRPAKKISVYQNIKLALIKNDYNEFNRLKNELIKNKGHEDASLESKINNCGYLFINRKEIDNAVKILKKVVAQLRRNV